MRPTRGGLVGGFLIGWMLARPIDVTAREQAQSRLVVQQMADTGNDEAAFRLGGYYDHESFEPNYELALKYYQMASENGHAWATNNLGALYSTGRGVPKDEAKASDFIHKAATQHSQWPI